MRLSPGFLDKDAIPVFTRGDNFAGDALHTRMVFTSDCAFLDFLDKNSNSPEIVNLRLAMRSFLKSESGTITGPVPGDLDAKIKAVFPNASKKTGEQIDLYNYGPLLVGFSNTYPQDEDYVGEDIIATFSWAYADPEQVETDAVKIKELLKNLKLDNGASLYFTQNEAGFSAVIIAESKVKYESLWSAMDQQPVSIKSMMAASDQSWQELVSLTDPKISGFTSDQILLG